MSLILNRLGINFISRGLGTSDVDLIEQCEVISFGISNEVIVNKQSYPLTGTFKGVKGWTWNKTKPQDLSDKKKTIESFLGGHSSNLEEGSVRDHWFGSVLSGIVLDSIDESQYKTKRKRWIPKYTPGVYSIFHLSKKLYSNKSSCEVLNVEGTNLEGNHTYEIKNKFIDSSVSITLFKRDSNFNNIPAYTYSYDTALNDELSFRFESDTNKIEFKSLKQIQIGSSAGPTVDEVQCKYEHLGLGNKHRGICYTEYFPAENLELKTIQNDMIYDWTPVSNFIDSSATDRHYILDKETGRILFSNNYPVVNFSIKDDSGGVLELHGSTESFPERGYITVGVQSELLYFYGKKKYGLYVCNPDLSERGVSSLNEGELGTLKYGGMRLKNLEQIYVSYTAKPRIDFECIDGGLFSSDLNIKPYTKINSNGIIELSPQEKHVSELTLTCDKSKIGRDIYGPMFLQGDTTILKAAALNNNKKPVSEIDITFFGREGSFEGDVPAPDGITKVSNKEGIAKAAYFYPYSNNALSGYSEVYLDGNDSYLIYNNLGIGTQIEDITIFQVFKTDAFSGSLGRELNVVDKKIINLDNKMLLKLEDKIGLDYKEYELNQLDRSKDIADYVPRQLNLCDGKEWNTGMCLIELDYNMGTVGPVLIEKVIDETSIQIRTSGLSQFRKIRHLPIKKVHMYKRAELDWSGLGQPAEISPEERLNRSLNKVLYKIDGATGLYEKVIPSRIVNNRIYFDGIHLPANSMSDRNNIIAMYKIMASKNVTLHARCIDPATGFEIRSNQIKLKIDFPNYLKSENGFRFKTLDSEDSGGLGGANFIAINPTDHTSQINLHFLD